ncbi:MAG: hypothetical protein M0P16_04745 [Syntrophales bacterium]|nr:hypothetical protein [Syntrophales bacterium]MCK9392235.1 hypothetical protein [Syntrophales bacterium]
MINAELIEEISGLKQRIQELEFSDSVRKRAEEALRNGAQWLHIISDASPIPAFVIGLAS